MKKAILRSYAKLIATVGTNIQKGQDVIIQADLDQPDFVSILVDECYKAGARKVIVDWDYQPLTKLHVKYRSKKTLGEVTTYEKEKWQYQVDNLPCKIYLLSEDPDGLKGINQKKMAEGQQSRYKYIKPYREQMEGKYQWCIAAVPGVKWAKKVFPKLSKNVAVEALWDAILKTSRVTDDPVKEWNIHNKDLKDRCAYLNSLHIKELQYTASNGTNLKVGMIDEALFCGGMETSLMGKTFNPNIPSEECFISPKKGKAEGIVYSSKPLSYQGQLIDNFSITFKDGKVSEVKAKQNEELLKKLVNMDEGASYLGECALVPFDSPINNTGILFYNTLFDENACCHLALGKGFIDTIKDYDKYTLDEMYEMGINNSMIHEDFMIGTSDLSIVAITRDNKKVQIFKDGNWAF